MIFYPTKKEFVRLARRGNLIPVYTEILADTETPVSSFSKIMDSDYAYLLESVEGGERIGRYSFLGGNPSLVFRSKGRDVEIIENRRTKKFRTYDTPLDELKKLLGKYRFVRVKGLPRFCGGLVGYMGYDMVRFFENIPDKNPDPLNLDDSIFVLTDTILIFDHIDQKIKIVSNAHIRKSPSKAYEEATRKIRRLVSILKKEATLDKAVAASRGATAPVVKSNFTEKGFKACVKKAKEYIRKGDIIQVVLSQRFRVDLKRASSFNIYRALRSINPSPYMFYLKLKDAELIGSSPELLVRCEEGQVETRPIAGTRKRGADDEEDRALAKELLDDPKERAEHIMLVDLGRNDLGRVSKSGTVRLPEFMIIEKYSHVMHIVTSVVGELKRGRDSFDTIAATFPAGTVTGAPKIRAMEIIDELENIRRGAYAGCVGYFSFSGNLDTCITIRTIIVKKNKAYIQAGAGIVADSRPSREYRETQSKARALISAIEMAEKGF